MPGRSLQWLGLAQAALALVLLATGYHAAAALNVAASICWFGADARRLRGRLREASAAATSQATLANDRQQQVQLQRELLASVAEGIVAVDSSGRIAFANDVIPGVLQRRGADCPGRSIEDAIAIPQLVQAIRSCLANGRAVEVEIGSEGADAPRVLEVRVTPMVRPDATRGALALVHDRSRLRQLESYRRDFVANVSHELKTPLAAIQGFCETLLDDPEVPAPTRQRFLERISRQTQRLANLVGDLLTLSRLDEERGIAMGAEPCDLVHVVKECLRDLRPLADRKRLRLEASLHPDRAWIRAEPESLRQVVGNLVDNAIKYTAEGGRIEVRVRGSGAEARIEVEDNGIGLAPEDRERVFERFYRVDKARSNELGSTGLGLAIVKNTVINLGGTIGVESTLGKGSTFWVALPLAGTPENRLASN